MVIVWWGCGYFEELKSKIVIAKAFAMVSG